MRTFAWFCFCLAVFPAASVGVGHASVEGVATSERTISEPTDNDDYLALRTRIAKIVKKAAIGEAKVGIAVMEVESGEMIYELGSTQALNPASGVKILTAFAALYYLGPEYRFKTTLLAQGKLSREIENIYIKGEGDPSFETQHLREMVATAWDKGLRVVSGDIVIDDSYFDGETLPYAFDHHPKSDEESPFRAPVGAASINANTIQVTVFPGPKVGAPATTIVFPTGYVKVRNELLTGAAGTKDNIQLETSKDGERMRVTLRGSVPLDYPGATFSRRAEEPALLFGYSLLQLLEERGIKVSGKIRKGKIPDKPVRIALHSSEPLSTLLFSVGKDSSNFYAEQILKVIGRKVGGAPGTTAKGAQAVKKILVEAGIDPDGVTMRNASGLYDANLISAGDMAKFLRFAFLRPEYQPEFLAQLAVGGVDGTLRGRHISENYKRYVRAKTGTLRGVTSLSGYVLAPAGRKTICFSIIVNKGWGKMSRCRAMQDSIVKAIASFLWKGKEGADDKQQGVEPVEEGKATETGRVPKATWAS